LHAFYSSLLVWLVSFEPSGSFPVFDCLINSITTPWLAIYQKFPKVQTFKYFHILLDVFRIFPVFKTCDRRLLSGGAVG